MSKSKKTLPAAAPPISQKSDLSGSVETGRGIIKDNFLAALVTSRAYRSQVVKAKKGKGAYQRKDKHLGKGRESYLIAA